MHRSSAEGAGLSGGLPAGGGRVGQFTGSGGVEMEDGVEGWGGGQRLHTWLMTGTCAPKTNVIKTKKSDKYRIMSKNYANFFKILHSLIRRLHQNTCTYVILVTTLKKTALSS